MKSENLLTVLTTLKRQTVTDKQLIRNDSPLPLPTEHPLLHISSGGIKIQDVFCICQLV